MTRAITIRPWVAILMVGLWFVFAYFVVSELLWAWKRHHKYGESAWLDAAEMVSGAWPFGYYGLDIEPFEHLVNGLFWGCIGFGLGALRLWSQQKSLAVRKEITIRLCSRCFVIGLCFVCGYFVVTQLLFDWKWYDKYDRSQLLGATANVCGGLPFGNYGLDIAPFNYLVNGLFWGCVGVGLGALRVWRRTP